MERPSIEEVMTRNEDDILGIKGVVGVGIGQNESREECLLVFVERRDPEIEMAIPKELEGYEVKIQEIGEVKAL